MTQQKQILPFEAGTRRRRIKLNTIPFVDSQSQTLRLPQVGYLAHIELECVLTFNASAATAFAGDALYKKARSILKKILLKTNMQSQIVSASAWGLLLMSYITSPIAYASDQVASEVNAAPAAAGAQTFRFKVDIPVSYNLGLNYTLGLLNLQNDDVAADLSVDWGSLAGLFATPANISGGAGYIVPTLTYYDVPNPAEYAQPNLDYLCMITEQLDNIVVGTGEHRFNVPRGNVYAQLVHHINDTNVAATTYAPNVTSGKVQTLELKMQGATTDEKVDAWLLEQEQRRRYGLNLPQGTYVNDFAWDTDLPGRFELGYNLLDSAQFSDLVTIFGVQGMGSATSQLLTVSRQIVRLDQ